MKANCRHLLEAALSSPSSLDILKEIAVYATADEPFVSFQFDASNAFGAIVRGRARCDYGKDSVLKNGGAWQAHATAMTINGQAVDSGLLEIRNISQ